MNKRNVVCKCIKHIMKELKTEPEMLSRVATGDESWIFDYDHSPNGRSLERKSASSPRPKKARLFKSKIKVMLIVFLDVHGIVHVEFLPQDQTINQNVNKDTLRRLIREKRIVGDQIMAASSRQCSCSQRLEHPEISCKK